MKEQIIKIGCNYHTTWQSDRAMRFILVEIKDTGKGIDKEEIKYIWNKYYHNEKKHKRNTFGTGLRPLHLLVLNLAARALSLRLVGTMMTSSGAFCGAMKQVLGIISTSLQLQ
jgi:K+-sensing histidine kinase KdpD